VLMPARSLKQGGRKSARNAWTSACSGKIHRLGC